MKVQVIKTFGGKVEVEINKKLDKKLSLEEMQDIVGGMIECVELPDGRTMVLNEEGRLNGSPLNIKASMIWRKQFPMDKFPHNNLGDVYGDVFITSKDYPWNEE